MTNYASVMCGRLSGGFGFELVNCCILTVHVACVVRVYVCHCVCCLWCRLQSSLPEHDLVVASYDVVRNDLSFFR